MPAPARRPQKSKPKSGSQSRGRPKRRARRSTSREPAAPHEEGSERLQKVLAAAGVASRRECEQLILEGRVEVDHKVVAELGARVNPDRHEIRVDGELLHQPKLIYFAVHKPKGVVSTSRDPAGRPRVIDMLPPGAPRAYCVGRLDLSSEGLILVTNDGELANGLTHPRHGVEKTYQVLVAGRVEEEELRHMRRGLHLAEGFAKVNFVRIKSHRKQSTLLEMVLDEGRNREIRRILARLGHKVQRLTRTAVGPLRLGDLPAGAVRPLTRQEITALRRAVTDGRSEESATAAPRPRPAKETRPDRPSIAGKKRKIIGG